MTLYMIGMYYAGAVTLMGVADSLEAAQAHVLSHCRMASDESPTALEWEMTSRDNFENLLWHTDCEDMSFTIKTATLITKEN